MPKGDYRQTIRCVATGCRETITYRHETRRDEAASIKSQQKSPWKCARHLQPDQVLGPEREIITSVLTVTSRPDARSWESSLIWAALGWPFRSDSIHGPGFRAFASDWPAGTRLEITARILPPAGGEAQEGRPRCSPACWTSVNCPSCGNQLPPRGRSMPPEMGIMDCCDEARMNPVLNPRHLWTKEEAGDGP